MSVARLASVLRTMVTRGKVTSAAIGPRTVVAASGLANEQLDAVELLLPPGYVANPSPGNDILLLAVTGTRDHKVALGGDQVTNTVANLQPGEHGLRGSGQQIVLRINRIELLADGETLRQLVTDQLVALFNNHVHSGVQSGGSNTGVPTTPMTSDQLTGALHAGGQS